MYPLSVSISTETKIKLDALSALYQSPIGRTLELVVGQHILALPASERFVVEGLADAASSRLAQSCAGAPSNSPMTTYRFSRLCFRRDAIEPLGPDDRFRVETPLGVFDFSKSEFYRAFPNVVKSASYQRGGIYHYRVLPRHAEPFRIDPIQPEQKGVRA